MEKAHTLSTRLADLAVESLVEELSLTPKPGLVDQLDQGSHDDLTYSIMMDSAKSLHQTFYEMSMAAYGNCPSQELREKIGEIGRYGEVEMFRVTNGVNTHKGAIWSLGLITAATAIHLGNCSEEQICFTAGAIAKYEDRFIPHQVTNGIKAVQRYGVHGAKAEAQMAFPHIRKYSLPMLKEALKRYDYETAKFYSFLALVANLDDTCILHRGGMEGLVYAKQSAKNVLKSNRLDELHSMNENFIERNLSPGGSADLLAATIYVYKISQLPSILKQEVEGVHAILN
nr:triphosphoribosyl-dephospho-CoA synthase MdcB [Lysinibacillus timonensis]